MSVALILGFSWGSLTSWQCLATPGLEFNPTSAWGGAGGYGNNDLSPKRYLHLRLVWRFLIDLLTHFNPIRASPQRVNLQQAEWRERTPDFCNDVNRDNSFPIKTHLLEEQTEERKKKTTQKAQQQAKPLSLGRLKEEDHQRLGI